MKKVIVLTGLLIAGAVICSCGKNENPEEQENAWYADTKNESKEESSLNVRDYLKFSEAELFFGKEGGEKTISCPEQWGFYLGPEDRIEERWIGIELLYGFDEERKDIQRIDIATFTWTAGKLIVPSGYWTQEVVGERPNLSSLSKSMPSFDYINLYECAVRSYVQGQDKGFPCFEFTYFGFTTFIDMGWFTATREIADWYEYYEGFAYKLVTYQNTDQAGATAYNTVPSIGVMSKWWIPKELDEPGNYPVTIRVSPNTTGEPRQYILRTSAVNSPIIINQE